MMYVYLGAAIVLEVIGTTLLKASQEFSKLWPSLGTVCAYAGSFYLMSLALRTIPTGIAYAIWSGCGIVLVSLIAWIVFKQRLDFPAIAGMGLIIAGVLVINLFSNSATH
ncbi:SMR family transporter [uncultured Massilia sp.]|uniref:SMR family transporter n=1 Tax=uncultured Massilia sp. TaxID=169973 RepID=UPI0025F983D4|nr:SMR family transporter [uncultured Massilia sp.]